MSGFVRAARASDAAELARVQVASWQASLAGLVPDAVLAELRSPEAAGGGTIALVRDGDTIVIDIPRRELRLDVPESELLVRREAVLASLGSYRPVARQRPVSAALQVYAALATSAATGAARDVKALARLTHETP